MAIDEQCFEEEKEKIDDYVMKVFFFMAFSELLKRKGISVKIEPKIMQSNGSECIPDFYCENGGLTVIFEHKGSISYSSKYFAKEVGEVSKYLDLQDEYKVNFVVMVAPYQKIKSHEEEIRNMNTDLLIWGYNLNFENKTLTFIPMNAIIGHTSFDWLVEQPSVFEIGWLSIRKFIREEPPIVYTASFIWNDVLRTAINPWMEVTECFEVEFQEVCETAKQYFPASDEYNQITNKRVRDALGFLATIGWIEFPNKNGNITVKRVKRLRGEMVTDVLIAEFCKQWTPQSTLEEFQ